MKQSKLLTWTFIVWVGLYCSNIIKADPVGRALDGAMSGAVFGRLVGDKKTARKGAAIGAGIGLLNAASDSKSKKKRQAEIQRRQQVEKQRWEQERAAREQQLEAERQKQSALSSAPQVTPTLVLESQKSLMRMGIDPGEIDGKLSAATVNAIKLYEARHSLLETGRPSPELLKHMLKNGG